MSRIICIKVGKAEVGVTPITKGKVYTPIDTYIVCPLTAAVKKWAEGLYYKLAETGCWYHESQFIEINEDQQDESEMLKNRLPLHSNKTNSYDNTSPDRTTTPSDKNRGNSH